MRPPGAVIPSSPSRPTRPRLSPLRRQLSRFTLLVLLGACSTGRADDALPSEAQLRQRLGELQAAAIRRAGLGEERERSWRRRVRAAALLPTVRLQASRGVRELLAVDELTGQQVIQGGGDSLSLHLTASWSLERLAFTGDELAVEREAAQRAERRRQLLGEVTRLFFEQRRLAAVAGRPGLSSSERLEARLRSDEAGALLDALTSPGAGGRE